MALMQLSVLQDFRQLCRSRTSDLHVLLRMEFPIPANTTQRPPLHLALVLDRSSSMSGEKLELTKQAAVFFMNWLTRRDYLAVVAFASDVEVLVPHTQLSDKRAVAERIRKLSAAGQTNLSGGWLRGVSELLDHHQEGHIHRVILLTDGQANGGITSVPQLQVLASTQRQREVCTTTVGFGQGFDEHLLRPLAESGGGRFHYVGEPEQLAKAFQEEFGELSAIVGQNLEISVEVPEGVSVAEVLTDLPSETTPGGVKARLGDVRAGDVRQFLMRLQVREGFNGKAAQAPAGGDARPTTDGPSSPTLASAASLTVRLDALAGEELGPEKASHEVEVELCAELSPAPVPDPEVRREVWLARCARLKIEAARALSHGNTAAAAATLLRHLGAGEELARGPLEQLVRDEMERLRDLLQQIERGEDQSSLSKTMVTQSHTHILSRSAYRQQAGVRKLNADLSPRRPEEAADILGAAEKELKAQGYEAERIDKFKLALRELIENALEHGCGGRPDGRVRVDCTLTRDYARAIVSDDGPGFDYEAKLKAEQSQVLQPGKRGRGLLLIARLANRVSFHNRGGAVAEIVLERQALEIKVRRAPTEDWRDATGACGGPEVQENSAGIAILRPRGHLDSHTFGEMERSLAGLFAKGYYKLVVDLSEVDYISSSGAGVFIAALREIQENKGTLVLANPRPNVEAVFNLLGLSQAMRICGSVKEAMEFF